MKPRLMQILVILPAFIQLACSSSRHMTRSGPIDAPQTVKAVEGMASYYARSLHGRQTASGELYDESKFTAAHLTLKFGTIIMVTNLSNGQTVIVRINDRGPFIKDRIVDLSYAAAAKIDLIQAGIARVRLEILP